MTPGTVRLLGVSTHAPFLPWGGTDGGHAGRVWSPALQADPTA